MIKNTSNLLFETNLPGIPESCINAEIKNSTCDWSPVFVGKANSKMEIPHKNGGAEGWITFAAEGAVELQFIFPEKIENAVFRPSLQSQTEVAFDGNKAGLNLLKSRYGVLEINYQQAEKDKPAYTVYILGDSIMQEPLAENCAQIEPGMHCCKDLEKLNQDTVYFQPGLHHFDKEKLNLKTGQNLFLARGAVLQVGLFGDRIENVRVEGQGILDGSAFERSPEIDWREASGIDGFVCFYKGKNIIFDGVTIYNPHYWNIVVSGTVNATICNHKAISWLINNDGVQPRSCTNLLIENCFLKCNDDCIAIKTRRDLAMESRQITCRNLILWNDFGGNPLEIGHTSQADLLENVRFENIEIVFGCRGHSLDMCIIDHSLVRNVIYENIFIEGEKCPDIIGIHVGKSLYTTDDESGKVMDVTYRNIISDGPSQKIYMNGRGIDEKNNSFGFIGKQDDTLLDDCIENIAFESIYWNKTQGVKNIDELDLEIVKAKNIVLRPEALSSN